MGLPDPHDPRRFTHFARVNDAGEIVAVVEIADGAVESAAHPIHDGATDTYVDVTAVVRAPDEDLTAFARVQVEALKAVDRG